MWKEIAGFQKNCVIPQKHFVSHGFSPTKAKMHAIWVRKDLQMWVLFTCPWFNSFNYLWTCLLFVFGLFIFLGYFDYSKIKFQKHWKISKRQKYFILGLVLFFSKITWIIISLFWISWLCTLFSLDELLLLHFTSLSFVVHVVWEMFIIFYHFC